MIQGPSHFLPNFKAMTESADGLPAHPINITSTRFDTGQLDAQIGSVVQALKLGMT